MGKFWDPYRSYICIYRCYNTDPHYPSPHLTSPSDTVIPTLRKISTNHALSLSIRINPQPTSRPFTRKKQVRVPVLVGVMKSVYHGNIYTLDHTIQGRGSCLWDQFFKNWHTTEGVLVSSGHAGHAKAKWYMKRCYETLSGEPLQTNNYNIIYFLFTLPHYMFLIYRRFT